MLVTTDVLCQWDKLPTPPISHVRHTISQTSHNLTNVTHSHTYVTYSYTLIHTSYILSRAFTRRTHSYSYTLTQMSHLRSTLIHTSQTHMSDNHTCHIDTPHITNSHIHEILTHTSSRHTIANITDTEQKGLVILMTYWDKRSWSLYDSERACRISCSTVIVTCVCDLHMCDVM
jgi:hypothetical protein